MRTIVQLSDLHFGAILQPTLAPLRTLVAAIKPDLTIVSGDFTQRATPEQFAEAQAYVAQLPSPQMVMPGNHDVPLYNVFRRFLSPLDEYEKHISTNHAPSFIDDEVAIVGMNSARSFTFKGGALSHEQVAVASAEFTKANRGQVRIAVTHHPFDIPVGLSGVNIIHGAKAALEAFAKCDVDLVLTGHLHLVHRAKASVHVPGYEATLLGAGTATSTRARGEMNSFFVFRVDHTQADDRAIVVETHTWNPAKNEFEITDTRGIPRVSKPPVAVNQGQGSGMIA